MFDQPPSNAEIYNGLAREMVPDYQLALKGIYGGIIEKDVVAVQAGALLTALLGPIVLKREGFNAICQAVNESMTKRDVLDKLMEQIPSYAEVKTLPPVMADFMEAYRKYLQSVVDLRNTCGVD